MKKTPSVVKKNSSRALEVLSDLDVRVSMIQALIPLGLKAVGELLQEEVTQLAGIWYERKASDRPWRRWGRQQGSVYLSDQKVPISVPRVRNIKTDQEVDLQAYKRFQNPRKLDEGLLLRVLKGISCANYQACAEAVPEAFGISSSSVSRRFIKATAEKLRQFQNRSLETYNLVALFIDGDAEDKMLIALGITINGEKIPLGFVQTSTENGRVCRQFLQELIRRGLRYHEGLLVIVDGSKGLITAIRKTLDGYALIQRCQWHKREDVVAYLPKAEQHRMRRKLQAAYNIKTYEGARKALNLLKPQLELMNQYAKNSLEEGLEETLTLHRLGMAEHLEKSFRTTNCIESLNSQVGNRVRNIKRWKNSSQRHRWLAAALLDIEPRLRKVKDFRYLPLLKHAIQRELKLDRQRLSA